MLTGFIEAVTEPPYNGKADLPVIAEEQHLEVDELFPAAEALQLLRFAEVEGGDIRLTEAGTAVRAQRDGRAQEALRPAPHHLRAARGAHPPGAR